MQVDFKLEIDVDRNAFEPVWHQVAATLRSRILAEATDFRGGDKLPTEHELSEICAINRLTGRKALKALEAEGMIVRRQGKGSFVREKAVKLGALTIGFLAARDWWLTGGFVSAQIVGARKEAFRQERLVRTVLSSVEHERDLAEFCRPLDGLIVIGDGVGEEVLQALRRSGIRIVVTLTDRTALDLPSAVLNDSQAGYVLTRHLLERGHRRIALAHSIPVLIREAEFVKGYRRAMAANDIPVDSRLMRDIILSFDGGYHAAQEFLRTSPSPTAIVTTAPHVARGVLQAAMEAGRPVPEEVSVVTAGDGEKIRSEHGSADGLGLTAYEVSFARLGARAIDMLFRRLEEFVAPRCETVSGKLVVRGSSGGAPKSRERRKPKP